MEKDEIVKKNVGMEFHPTEITDQSVLDTYTKIPMTEIAGLGSIFAEMLPEFRTVTSTTSIHVKGLYRCTFPQGVSGYLAKFRDGSGSTGTIMNDRGIVGIARWNPVNSVKSVQEVTVPVSPMTMFMAVTMIEMNHKLDRIQRLGEEILNYQKEKDRAEQEANYEALQDTYNKFKYNLQNEKWKTSKTADVQNIKRSISGRIKNLRIQIDKLMDKHDLVHINAQTDQMIQNVQTEFRQYRLAVFMYAFSIFLETLLLENFSADYMEAVCADINDCAAKYREYYQKCYSQLAHSSRTTIGSSLLHGVAKVNDGAGRFIHKIPIVERGKLDEFLVGAGQAVDDLGLRQTTKQLEEFSRNISSGAEQFVGELEQIRHLYNDPVEVLVDNDAVYLKCE